MLCLFSLLLFVRSVVLAAAVILEHKGQWGVINIYIIITSHNNAASRAILHDAGPLLKPWLCFTFSHTMGLNFNHTLFPSH